MRAEPHQYGNPVILSKKPHRLWPSSPTVLFVKIGSVPIFSIFFVFPFLVTEKSTS